MNRSRQFQCLEGQNMSKNLEEGGVFNGKKLSSMMLRRTWIIARGPKGLTSWGLSNTWLTRNPFSPLLVIKKAPERRKIIPCMCLFVALSRITSNSWPGRSVPKVNYERRMHSQVKSRLESNWPDHSTCRRSDSSHGLRRVVNLSYQQSEDRFLNEETWSFKEKTLLMRNWRVNSSNSSGAERLLNLLAKTCSRNRVITQYWSFESKIEIKINSTCCRLSRL